jgi:hypothetical protein
MKRGKYIYKGVRRYAYMHTCMYEAIKNLTD